MRRIAGNPEKTVLMTTLDLVGAVWRWSAVWRGWEKSAALSDGSFRVGRTCRIHPHEYRAANDGRRIITGFFARPVSNICGFPNCGGC